MNKIETIKWPNGIEWLEITPADMEEQLTFAKENNIHYFIHNWHPTDNGKDLSFLIPLHVKGLNVTFSGIKSNEEINGFTDLRILKSLFGEPVTLLDFSNLQKLEELEITYNNKIKGLSRLVNLRTLALWKYKPASKNLDDFKGYKKIKTLLLVHAGIKSLDGIQELDQLNELKIARPRGFTDLFTGSSNECLANLQELEFSFCKELDFNTIPVLNKVTTLKILDCGRKIESLSFILDRFPNLTSLIFLRSELQDGNLDYLLQHPVLQKVLFDHKKHYNMEEKEINRILTKRQNS